MTTEATLAGSRAAPYCSAMLLTRKNPLSTNAIDTQPTAGAGGQGAWPCSPSTVARPPATSTPPQNMARARLSSERRASRRSITLLSPNEKPPSTPSQSDKERGSGQPCPPSGHNTMAAPASASSTRTAAMALSDSFSSSRASTTTHSGIR